MAPRPRWATAEGLSPSWSPHRTPEPCLEKLTVAAPPTCPSCHGSRLGLRLSHHLPGTDDQKVAHAPIGSSPKRPMRIAERSIKMSVKRSGGSIHARETPVEPGPMLSWELRRLRKAQPPLTQTPKPLASRPQPRPPIPGGTRRRFSTGPIMSSPGCGPRCAAPAWVTGLSQSTSCTVRRMGSLPGRPPLSPRQGSCF